MKRAFLLIGLVAVAFAATGCESVRKVVGNKKNAPDEFVVYKRPPLTLPPEYGLRPPTPGVDRPQLVSPRDEAKTAVLSSASQPRQAPQQQQPAGATPGVSALLDKTGARLAEPGIRDTVDRESTVLASEDRRFIDKLIFWVDDQPYQGTIVDAKKEQQRIMQNQALGKPITDGSVPEIKRKPPRKGLLDF